MVQQVKDSALSLQWLSPAQELPCAIGEAKKKKKKKIDDMVEDLFREYYSLLICKSVLMLLLHCFDYCHFGISFKIGWSESSNFAPGVIILLVIVFANP